MIPAQDPKQGSPFKGLIGGNRANGGILIKKCQFLYFFSDLSYGPLDRLKMIPQGVGTFSTIGQPILRTFIFLSFFDPNRPLPHLTLSPPWPRASGRKMWQIHCVLLCLSSRPTISRNVWRGRCHRLPSLRTTLSLRTLAPPPRQDPPATRESARTPSV